jgi:hypothetical protein
LTSGSPRVFSRKWFWEVAACCEGLAVLIRLVAHDLLGWHSGATLYWVLVGPLTVGFLAAGSAWLVLAARDARVRGVRAAAAQRDWRSWLTALGGVAMTVTAAWVLTYVI